MKMKSFYIFIFLCAASISSYAADDAVADFTVEGISYKILPNQQDVAVVMSAEGSYSGSIIIPQSIKYGDSTYTITHIGKNAFRGSDITSITLPDGLLEIMEDAFRECFNIKSIIIPSSVLAIDSEAFIFCYDLTSLTFKSTQIPYIGKYAFGKTKVNAKGVDVTIPANMATPDDSRYKTNPNLGIISY